MKSVKTGFGFCDHIRYRRITLICELLLLQLLSFTSVDIYISNQTSFTTIVFTSLYHCHAHKNHFYFASISYLVSQSSKRVLESMKFAYGNKRSESSTS